MLILDKILPLFVYPVGFAILLAAAALVLSASGWMRTSRAFLALTIAILWISSTPLFANWLYAKLEAQHPPIGIYALPPSDIAIVLGGAVRQPLSPRITSDADDSVDRVLHAARLFRADRVDAILVTGGNLPWFAAAAPESELIAELLIEIGVPREAITVETESRNTFENAVNSKDVMAAKGWQTAMLVTSAAHMPRAVAVFDKAGINAIPATTDIRVIYPVFGGMFDLLPTAGALERTTDAMKEFIGMIVYRMRGWA